MKPVENVSIGGYVFAVEEDACKVVREYLDELTSFYSKKVGGSEIMEGIEERLSELLVEQTGQGGVVTLQMVDSAIETLGRPEAIEEESEDAEPREAVHPRRKLYRDPAQGKVAGVCYGLGAYFDIDPTVFRLIFTVLTLIGLGIFWRHGIVRFRFSDYFFPLVYVVLWICMPVAKTVRQRDEMHGEKGTVDAISARVMSSVQEMGEAAGQVVKSSFWSDIWRIIEVCLGIILLVAGVAGVVSLGCVSVGNNLLSNTFILNRALEEIAGEAPWMLDLMSFPPVVIAFAVVLVIPFIAFVYGGIMFLFKLKEPKWRPGLCLFVIWLIALTVLAVLTAMFFFKGTI